VTVRRPLALLLAVCCLAALLGACSRGGSSGYHLSAEFDRGVSLYAGSDVRVLGLAAGKIDRVSIKGTKVRVDMTMQSDVPVPADVQATIVPLSLIGERYVQLFPAWTEGQPRAKSGAHIPLERTSVPVEPDEALAALKKFLDSLDPNATGRLVHNLADDLEGNGAQLNSALRGLSDLTVTLASKDQQLADLVDHFDSFTATLVTREQQLGKVMSGFATTAQVLSDERRDIERLVKALAQLSVDGLDLVSEHRVRLQHDVEVLTHTLLSVEANLDSVRQLLSAGPVLVAGPDLDGKNEGLNAAYDPEFHRIDLRDSTTPVLSDLFRAIGFSSLAVCLPVQVSCTPGSAPVPAVPVPALPAAAPNPVQAVVGLLGSPTGPTTTRAAELSSAIDRTPASAPSGVAARVRAFGRAVTEVVG
jgi:virulence factor Mce-like protein